MTNGADECVRPYTHAEAVIGQDFESFDVVVGLTTHDRVDAAGIVADHAADGAAVVAGGIGSEGEMEFFGGIAEMVEHDSGLHASDPALGINLENVPHIFREIESDRNVAALAGERSASAAAEQWRAKVAADGDGGL